MNYLIKYWAKFWIFIKTPSWKQLSFSSISSNEAKEAIRTLLTRINAIKSDFSIANYDITNKEDLYKFHIQSICTLISLLVKINGLLDFTEVEDKNCIKISHQFIWSCYECLIETTNSQQVSETIWRFNGYFFTIFWQNKLWNDFHQRLIVQLLNRVKIQILCLDSLDLVKKIASQRGHLFEDSDKLIIGQTEPEIWSIFGFDRIWFIKMRNFWSTSFTKLRIIWQKNQKENKNLGRKRVLIHTIRLKLRKQCSRKEMRGLCWGFPK